MAFRAARQPYTTQVQMVVRRAGQIINNPINCQFSLQHAFPVPFGKGAFGSRVPSPGMRFGILGRKCLQESRELAPLDSTAKPIRGMIDGFLRKFNPILGVDWINSMG
jgi:hypothetical protein